MIKWFFLAFIGLVFIASNGAIFNAQRSLDAYVFAGISANLFGISLTAMWMGAYYTKFRNAGYRVLGHSILMLSAGIALTGIGFHGLFTHACGFLIQDGDRPRIISRLAVWAVENQACSLLSFVFVGLGLLLAWPSLRLFLSARFKVVV